MSRRPGRGVAAVGLAAAAAALLLLAVLRSGEPDAVPVREEMPPPAPPPHPAAAPPAAPDAREAPPRVDAILRRALRAPIGGAPASRAEALATARDPEAPLARRIVAVRMLAARDDDEAFATLERILASEEAPVLLRAAVAEALGGAPHAAAPALLHALLRAEPPEVAAGAVRGLAARGTPEAIERVTDALLDPTRSRAVREQAARALGGVDDPAVRRTLRELFARTEDESLAGSLLEGLAAQDFTTVEPFFRALLESPEVDLERRLDAVEALGHGATALLLETAAAAEEPALRSAAVDALVGQGDPAVVGRLLARLPVEQDPAVRADLYAALAFEADTTRGLVDPERLVASVAAEEAPRVRLEGARAVAHLLPRDANSDPVRAFDRDLVPWLEAQARDAASPYVRLGAVDALGVGGTAGARDALRRLAREGGPVGQAAARARARLDAPHGGAPPFPDRPGSG